MPLSLQVVCLHEHCIHSAEVTHHGAGSFDATVRLWDLRAQNRQAIQILDEARDAIQTIHVGHSYIISGSVDGHVRTYDLRKGELRADYIGRKCLYFLIQLSN
jgi:mitogen-activated protein kinase organizer 1